MERYFHHKNKRKLRINNEHVRKYSVGNVKKNVEKKEEITKFQLRNKSPEPRNGYRPSSFKCYYLGCNANSTNKLVRFCAVPSQPTPTDSKQCEVLRNWHVKSGKRSAVLDQLGSPGNKHPRWHSDHEMKNLLKLHVSFFFRKKFFAKSASFSMPCKQWSTQEQH